MAQALAASQAAAPQAASSVQSPPPVQDVTIVSLSWHPNDWSIDVDAGAPFLALFLLCILMIIVFRFSWARSSNMEIDAAEIGVGESKLSFRPNTTDRQVAYAIWVELSTRKIGISIDLNDDVISEIYDSWYNYFSVTRELIKTVSVSKVRSKSTRQIINLSIDVLNSGLRPHLTKWQARYRHWYDKRIKSADQHSGKDTVIDPQSLQKQFPQYEELSKELMEVNARLIAFRESMQSLVFDLK